MKFYTLIFKFILIFILSYQCLHAQTGMRFKDFSKKLEPYFEKELINDLEKKLPQGSDYQIWGWDVGDYSGDGNNDVAFAVKVLSDKQKVVQVYQFVDIDGFLTLVGQFPYEYFEMPLEVGIVIKLNTCYVMKKHKLYEWTVRGYRFVNGNMVLLDDFHTSKIENYTHESYKNYQNLVCTEKYIQLTDNKDKLKAKYLVIPSYPRGKRIYNGYNEFANVDDIDFVIKGAWYWKGPEDASFTVKSAYDAENLYMTVNIKDDIFVPLNCDSCIGDYIEVWFDLNSTAPNMDRFVTKTTNKITFRGKEEAGIYSIKIYPGNFLDKKSYVKEVSSTDDLEKYQKDAVNNIKTVAVLKDSGYALKFKIPFALFGFEGAPISKDKPTEIGCTVVFHDIDNEFRPEEETQLATSSFNSEYPSSYGSLMIIPSEQWYGEAVNIYTQDIIRYLIELGF